LGGALLYYGFLQCARNHKATTKPPQRLPQKTKSLIFNGFMVFIVVIVVWHKYIELLSFLPAKIVPTD
jgi:hypothetical protein